MSDNCPGCVAHRATLSEDERARIPLREAAHDYHYATDVLFDLVRKHGWGHPLVVEAETKMNAADERLAQAAREYAKGTS